ncbi:MAG: hypothetical protein ACTHME_01355 [Candidatus Nitrosocosmicus sp.]
MSKLENKNPFILLILIHHASCKSIIPQCLFHSKEEFDNPLSLSVKTKIPFILFYYLHVKTQTKDSNPYLLQRRGLSGDTSSPLVIVAC